MKHTGEFFIDGRAYWEQLKKDIRNAKKNIYIQTFSFEADRVGKALVDSLALKKNLDKKILVDSYSKIVISDKWFKLPKYRKDHELQNEVEETSCMFKQLDKKGIQLKLTNPLGILYSNLPARNHKKLVIIDDEIVYIGGINFSEHNFNWHDLMFRMCNKIIAQEVKNDFLADWNGTSLNKGRLYSNDIMSIVSTNGKNNKEILNDTILIAILNAKSSIFIESPYITFPFFNALKKASIHGVKITIITTASNNHPMFTDYLVYEANKNNISIRLLPKMTHLKAMLIDNSSLFIGSLNFDFLCYDFHREIFIKTQDIHAISEFIDKVVAVDIKTSIPSILPVGSYFLKGIMAKFLLITLRGLFFYLIFFKQTIKIMFAKIDKLQQIGEKRFSKKQEIRMVYNTDATL